MDFLKNYCYCSCETEFNENNKAVQVYYAYVAGEKFFKAGVARNWEESNHFFKVGDIIAKAVAEERGLPYINLR